MGRQGCPPCPLAQTTDTEEVRGADMRREKLAKERVQEDEEMKEVQRSTTEKTLLYFRTEILRRRIERVRWRVEEQLVGELVREAEEGGVEGELV